MKKLGIYLHIPFCVRKCNYCDFYSVKWDEETEYRYIESIIKEIKGYESLNKIYDIDTIYIGGGTPTVIKAQNTEKIINQINKIFAIDKNLEISMEANPNTLTSNNVSAYKNMGINRLSIGIQSLDDLILKSIGRLHDSNDSINAIRISQKYGFENINADVMFNIPKQTVESVRQTIKLISAENIPHISFYSLKLEEGTPMYLSEKNNEISMIDEDTERDMYYEGRKIMAKNNLNQYEISNFSKTGYECRHNIKYWHQQEYIGLGPSAHSFMGNKRYSNASDIKTYCQNAKNDSFERIIHEDMNKNDLVFEYIMLYLRLTAGLDIREFNKKFDLDFEKMYQVQILFLIQNDLIIYKEHNIRLTEKGMDLSNIVFQQFLLRVKM